MSDPLFVSPRVEAEWGNSLLNALLKRIVSAAIDMAEAAGWTPTLTCIFRTPLENDALYGGHGDHLTGVHVLWRGVDMRSRDNPTEAQAIADDVNGKWVYDPNRPGMVVALMETAGDPGSGAHLHLQVSPVTVARV